MVLPESGSGINEITTMKNIIFLSLIDSVPGPDPDPYVLGLLCPNL
jgi:hypothetical protein